MASGKQVQVKIFDSGDVLVKTLTDVTLSSFDWVMNGGLGKLNLILSRKIDNFGEGSEIDLNFRVEVRIVDRETPPEGKLVYQGFIQSYRQIASGGSESIEVVCLGYQSRMATRVHQDSSGNTTVTYTSRDPSYMVTDLITSLASKLSTTAASIENTGLSLTYTFRNNTAKEVMDKVIDLSPNGYFWFTDANNILYFRKSNYDKPKHILKYARDFTDIEIEKSIDQTVNTVYFVGGGNPNLFRKTSRQGSISNVGKFEHRITDQRVTVTNTADKLASNVLDRFDHALIRIRLTLSDSNLSGYPESGVDIESFAPGDVVLLRNLVDEKITVWDQAVWDQDFWDFDFQNALANPFIITKINYNYTSVTLELGEFLDTFGREFQQLEDTVNTNQFTDLPSSPTAV